MAFVYHSTPMEVRMDGDRSREALAKFLDYLAEKDLMAGNTVQSRKAAASVILGILDKDEATDVTKIDVEDIVSRFARLHGSRYTPASLTAYKSRLRSALSDFESYLSNPLVFRPGLQRRERPRSRPVPEVSEPGLPQTRPESVRSSFAPPISGNVLPIPIRADLTIYIQGLPFDLTESEARKIAAVVTAMAQA
jgi:hypothetical protein